VANLYKLSILHAAQQEIHEIARLHLALVGPQSARNITNKLHKALSLLKAQPHIGAYVHDPVLRRAGYRMIISGVYLCIYRLIDNMVFVYHVVDGRTNYPRLLSDLPMDTRTE
jgi:plasmid stabilization system protein ParE